MQKQIEKIRTSLNKFTKKDYVAFRDTIDELCKNGTAKGCYKDYTILVEIITILDACALAIKEKE